MRLPFAFLGPAFLGLALLTAAAPVRDWGATATRNAAGAYVIGNPAARVKIVEYASYTCSHCAAFSVASAPVLKGQMIRSGSTSLEVRHMVRDALDLAAVVIARCAGPRGFAATSAAIFAAQDDWLPRGAQYQQANAARLQMYPELARLKSLADGAGLTALAKARGQSDAALNACFADKADVDRAIAMTTGAPAQVQGTPTFYVNGKIVPTVAWPQLEPVLRAQGAK